MLNSWFDLETFSRVPIKDGTYKYAEHCEVMIWAFADGDGTIYVWDLVNGEIHWEDDISGAWRAQYLPVDFVPAELIVLLKDSGKLLWGHNAGNFDFPVIDKQLPVLAALVPWARRRDTMVQAYSHGLPGSLEKLGSALKLASDKRKDADGKRLVRLFCMPQNEAFQKKWGADRATKETHPEDWQKFIRYAGGDIKTMREAHRLMPKWNMTERQHQLWTVDMKIQNRGFAVDLDLAHAAVRASDAAKADLAKRGSDLTEGAVASTTQRDVMLKYLLASHGVELPDMRADTLERRIDDPELPEGVKELLKIRLQASMNSVSKYKTLLKGVNSDGRLRGTGQFRGAARTGRRAHRLVQPGNLPRPTLSHVMIQLAIESMKVGSEDLLFDNIMQAVSSSIRGMIVAPPGKKLVVADLSNIEGRMAAWLAGEAWKLGAFRDFDAGTGPDLYILAYAKAFNVDWRTVPKKGLERQIGKVLELMLQYQGGVGAFLTGAATYGIDLDKMTEAVLPVLPADVLKEAREFLQWLYSKEFDTLTERVESGKLKPEDFTEALEAAKLKARFGLEEDTFVACDSLKRLWRRAHPQIVSYWKELEDTVIESIENPGVTFQCRKVKIRSVGAWMRIALPSGRELCYPEPKVKNNKISYVGPNQYTRNWERLHTYGGKLFENCIAEGTLVLTQRGWVPIETVEADSVVWDGVEWVTQNGCVYRGKQLTIEAFGARMTPDHRVLTTEGWRNASSSEGLDRADARVPDSHTVFGKRRSAVDVGNFVRLRADEIDGCQRVHQTAEERNPSLLRMHASRQHFEQEHEARDVQAPGLRRMAQHARPLSASFAQGLGKIRWARDKGLHVLAALFRRVLDRHGANLSSRVDTGTDEQQQGLFASELRVGFTQATSCEHASNDVSKHPGRPPLRQSRSGPLRGETDHIAIPPPPRLAGATCVEPVYDLMNCGPRQRFVVQGADGQALIVHNCVQAAAADQLFDPMPAIEEAGYAIVLDVHDEDVTETPDTPEFTAEKLAALMCSKLPWNEGLPLAAAGFEAYRYRKE